jgi:hypothetical protein
MKIQANPEKVKNLLQGLHEIEKYPLVKNGEPVVNNAGQLILMDNKLGPKAIYANLRNYDTLIPINDAFAKTLKALDSKYQFIFASKPAPPESATDEEKANYDKEIAELGAAHQKEVDEVLATAEEVELHCFSVHQLNLGDPQNRIPSSSIRLCRDVFLDIEELEKL